MALTNFPLGVTSFGMPLAGPQIPSTTGNVYFVSSVVGAGGNNGSSPKYAFATLAQGITACTASQGDIVVLGEGHEETIIGAAGSGVTKAGITIIGLGTGTKRPTFSFTTAIAASFNITAANTTIQNCVFTVGFDALTAMINVTGADVSFLDCDFNTNTGAFGVVLGILTAATAARLKILRCRFLGPATNSGTTITAQIKHEVGVDYVIEGCYFTGKMTQAILNATALLRGSIHSNRFVVATGTLAISVNASSTPFISDNFINVPSGTTPITAAAGFVAGNQYSAAAGVTAGTALTI